MLLFLSIWLICVNIVFFFTWHVLRIWQPENFSREIVKQWLYINDSINSKRSYFHFHLYVITVYRVTTIGTDIPVSYLRQVTAVLFRTGYPRFQIQYIPRNMHTVFALLCFVVVIHWLIFPYPSGLLHWHCGNLTIAPVPAKQPWWIWINTSCEFIMNDCITTTKQSTTKPCAYFLGYTVSVPDLPCVSLISHDGERCQDRNHKNGWGVTRMILHYIIILLRDYY